MKIFVWLTIIARLIVGKRMHYVGIDFCNYSGFGASFGVPEVVLTILHFGDTVAVLILVKNVLLLFERKIHEVIPTCFFDITTFFISYLLNG